MKRPLLLITIIYVILIILLRPLFDKPVQPFPDQTVSLLGVVDSEPVKKEDKFSFDFKVIDGGKGEIKVFAPPSKVRYGDKVKVAGTLSYTESPQNPGLSGNSFVFLSTLEAPEIISRGHGNLLIGFSFNIRKHFLNAIQNLFPSPYAELLCVFLFGTAAKQIPEQIMDNFKKTNSIHVLVVSGQHLSILVGVGAVVLGLFKLPRIWNVLIITFLNLIYVLATGAGASIVRAAIMAEMVLIAPLFERENDFLTSLSISALILLILNPLTLFNIGFQLSFAATVSLVYLAPEISVRLKYLPKFAADILSITFAPILMTSPIILYNFSQISLVAVLANLFLLFFVEYIVILGFGAALAGMIFLPLAEILSGTLFLMLYIMNNAIGFLANLPMACVYFRPPSFLIIMAYYIGMARLINSLQSKKQLKITLPSFVIGLLIIFLLFIWNAALAPAAISDQKNLTVTFLDIGQGDAIYIEAPSGENMLIDGGPSFSRSDMGKKVILPFLHKKGINKLDVMVLTHPHDDHVSGLVSVLSDMPVGMVIDSGQAHTSNRYLEFLELINRKKIKYMEARAGQDFNLGAGVKAVILQPSDPLIEESALNNNSVVIKIMFGEISFLFMGDTEKEGEERILDGAIHDLPHPATILKVGHHGSRTASSRSFIAAVRPRIAIISCGRKNKFRHPHRSTMMKFNEMGIKTYRTDLDGAVTVGTDGEKIVVKKERKI